MNLKIAGQNYDLNQRILHMAILNVTPDSFSDGGKYKGRKDIDNFIQMSIDHKVDIIDIGGESTRPGSKQIDIKEELDRTIPIIEYIKENTNIHISIDTYKSEVAEKALETGAVIVNDISAGTFDEKIFQKTADHNACMVLMHILGKPQTMQNNPVYNDLFNNIKTFLSEQIATAKKAGIDQLVIDPGIGFGKTFQDNFKLITGLNFFQSLKAPILIGASRKAFLQGKKKLSSDEREEGTISVHTAAVLNGARIIRAHDIEKTAKMIEICEALIKSTR